MAVFDGGLQDTQSLFVTFTGDAVFDGTFVTVLEGLCSDSCFESVLGDVYLNYVFTGYAADSVFDSVVGGVDIEYTLDLEKKMTNYGKKTLLLSLFQNTAPTSFKMVLCTDDGSGTYEPTEETENLSSLKEIPQGRGYLRGGVTLYRNSTDFPTVAEGTSPDSAYVISRTVTFTASGGSIPVTGNPIYYAVLVNNSDKVIAYYVLSETGLTVSSGQSLSIQGFKLRLT